MVSGVSTVFVNNIPPEVHREWLWNIFHHFGKVVDVFIPRNKSKRGRKFGFVRYADKDGARRAVFKLNRTWLLDYRIGVNITRFNARSTYWRKIQNDTKHARKVNGPNYVKEKITNRGLPQQETLNKHSQDEHKQFSGDERSYLEATINDDKFSSSSKVSKVEKVMSSNPPKFCYGEIEVDALKCLKRCAIGSEFYDEVDLIENFNCDGVFRIMDQKLFGKYFLLEFEDVELLHEMGGENWAPLRKWFDSIEPWSEDFTFTSRPSCLACYGVPLHAWNEKSFKNIAEIWGEFVSVDLGFVSRGILLIMTDQLERIDEVIELNCGDKVYRVRVTEIYSEVKYKQLNLSDSMSFKSESFFNEEYLERNERFDEQWVDTSNVDESLEVLRDFVGDSKIAQRSSENEEHNIVEGDKLQEKEEVVNESRDVCKDDDGWETVKTKKGRRNRQVKHLVDIEDGFDVDVGFFVRAPKKGKKRGKKSSKDKARIGGEVDERIVNLSTTDSDLQNNMNRVMREIDKNSLDLTALSGLKGKL